MELAIAALVAIMILILLLMSSESRNEHLQEQNLRLQEIIATQRNYTGGGTSGYGCLIALLLIGIILVLLGQPVLALLH